MSATLKHREPHFSRDLPAVALLVRPEWHIPSAGGRGRPARTPTIVALLLHLLLLAMILVDLRDWFRTPPEAPPPTIEVTLVQPPPPPAPPPAPPAPAKPPEPVPPVPLASDAMSEAPGKPAPAEKGEAAPAAPEPGPPAAPEPKREPPTPPQPVAKPAPTEPRRSAGIPTPRTTAPARPIPTPASPTKTREPETQSASLPPATERAPTPRGETPPAPGEGKDKRTGFEVTGSATPGGLEAAAYNAYLRAVRDKIFQQRQLLRTYYLAGGMVAVGIIVDRAGRAVDFGVEMSSGSYSLDNTVKQMVALAAPFGPLPPELPGPRIRLRFILQLPTDDADWREMMGTGGPG